jgi:hypothetical protein
MTIGVKRSEVADINKMILSVNAPSDEKYNDTGEDFYFELDLSSHEFQEIPEDLR